MWDVGGWVEAFLPFLAWGRAGVQQRGAALECSVGLRRGVAAWGCAGVQRGAAQGLKMGCAGVQRGAA